MSLSIRTPAADLIPRTANGGVQFPNLPARELVKILWENGLPLRHALPMMDSPQLKIFATIFYFDVIEKEHGDSAAAARVDFIRERWMQMRRAEKALGNDPEQGAKPHLILPNAT
jgi:hypothetical protein